MGGGGRGEGRVGGGLRINKGTVQGPTPGVLYCFSTLEQGF